MLLISERLSILISAPTLSYPCLLYTSSHGRLVSEELLGDLIGTYTVLGIDEIEGDRYAEKFEVYQLKYADKLSLIHI